MPPASSTGFKEVLGAARLPERQACAALRYSRRSHAALVSGARSVVFSDFVMRSMGS